jgi:hypothetical protein
MEKETTRQKAFNKTLSGTRTLLGVLSALFCFVFWESDSIV